MREEIQTYIGSSILNGDIEVNASTSLYESGLISSMGHLKLIQFLERRFNVSLPMSEIVLEEFDTVDKIVEFVTARRA